MRLVHAVPQRVPGNSAPTAAVSRLRWALLPLCLWAFLVMMLAGGGCAHHLPADWPIMPEQRSIEVRDLYQLPKARLPNIPPPPTVSEPQPNAEKRYLSLDEAIRIALANSEVVRVLAGVTAVSSGQTIYNPAISNTIIDIERARFDPVLSVLNSFDRTENPQSVFDTFNPSLARINGIRTDGYNLNASLSKTNIAGGVASVSFVDTLSRFVPGLFPLNPQNRYATTLGYEQPLLQGASIRANLAPIVIARINTERSFFQYKAAVQDMVRGVIEAYWALVFARTDVWARQQQVKQGQLAYDYTSARLKAGFGTRADVAQAEAALANFKVALVSAEANQLQREAALRNILGFPPSDNTQLIPITPPTTDEIRVNWDAIVRLAEERRPDLIELKLIIEADQQQLLIARNQALPAVDFVSQYRWNGLGGKTPTGDHISSDAGQFTDWTLGVNVALPLGLRASRAALRQQELILARDWANLDQGLHAVTHDLATVTRNLSQFYEQYKSLRVARKASFENLEQQAAEFRSGRTILLNVLQAITDWGNAVSAEAQTLAQYNSTLANLERETGTILETHGIYFYQERFAAIGPAGRLARPKLYPESLPPGPNVNRYPTIAEPAENIFDLRGLPMQYKKEEPK